MFKPIETEADLPKPGALTKDAREKHDLEFKTFADPKKGLEHAKDLAAFANAFGGTILIGVSDKGGVLERTGLKEQTAKDVASIYEVAGGRCDPPLAPDVVPIGDVVAVNVSPRADTVIAVPAFVKPKRGERAEKSLDPIEGCWRFPIRRASQTHDLEPKDLPMLMNPVARRAYIRLKAIEGKTDVHVEFIENFHHLYGNYPKGKIMQPATVTDVSWERNRVTFTFPGKVFRIPLADVSEVWDAETNWCVRVSGVLEEGQLYVGHPPSRG